eukprot:TRINITY_DN4365_c0_g1_i4.p1 TRINITY_DN4365_c0_g1~~TRINITY_DN4365_c0_g1_i4.p1  ORF type:complete len:443 (-),score=64.72 TRINITY_DN4365_c0_g1_i4:27-1355(-)
MPPNKYDVYAIGTQECQYSPKAGGNCNTDWNNIIAKNLGDSYIQLTSVNLRDIRLVVFIKNTLFPFVSAIQGSKEATGIANVIGNKGGVGISFNFHGTSFCFVNSHLAAHQSMTTDRNLNVEAILSSLHLGYPDFEVTTQFCHLFFFGDLNYRIDMDRDEVVNLISQQQWDELLEHDQLLNEQRKEKVFYGFHEGPISFAPTYRFIVGTTEYNPKKGRIPSWCDRVLWRSLPGLTYQPGEYSTCPAITTSDHSPVYATFEVDWTPQINIQNLDAIYSKPTCELEFLKLNGHNLATHNHGKTVGEESGRRMDPFLCMWVGTTLAVEGNPLNTAVIKNSHNPAWQRDDLPIIPLYGSIEEGSPIFLFVQVRDSSLSGQDDAVSQCAVPLHSLFEKKSDALNGYRFTATLISQGLPCGELSGMLRVKWLIDEAPKFNANAIISVN